jgi:hypothetical protein
MPLQLNSALIAIAAEFTGQYTPYQSVQISPGEDGGVFVASTDKGNIACLAFDPLGTADQAINILPSSDLMKAARGIKTADREISITNISTETCSAMAKVTTIQKSTNKVVEVPIQLSTADFPPLADAMVEIAGRWGKTPSMSATAGRYDATYLQKAVKVLGGAHASITFSSLDGGPLRVQSADQFILIMIMPQSADPIPPVPDWLPAFAAC